MWEVFGASYDGSLNKYLQEGWEPFSVTEDRDGYVTYWLRRKV